MRKLTFWSLLSLGSLIGAYLPGLWHQSAFSASGIIGSLVGSGAGIYAYVLLKNYTDL